MANNEEEEAAFNELKKRMKGTMESDLYEDDNMFYRFLKARDFKIDLAEKMLRDNLIWRKKYDIKNISEYDPPQVLKEYAALNFIGYTKEGSVVRYLTTGNIDFKGLWSSCTIDEWLKHLFKVHEEDIAELKRRSKMSGKPMEKFLYIHEMKELTIAKAADTKAMSQFIEFFAIYQDNYPELLRGIYIINAPAFASFFYNLVKPFLASEVIKKIRFYSDDSFKKDLLEIIDAEVLPAFLGGERTDPDGNPLCTTFIYQGGQVPEKYYNRNKDRFISLTEVEKVSVPRADIVEIYEDIKEPGTVLEWEYLLKTGDIKFGIFYRNEVGEKIEVVAFQKKSPNEYTEAGFHRCENIGTYIIVFDNSFSILRSKDVFYKLRTIPPRLET